MRALSIVIMIISLLLIIAILAAMGAAYSDYQNQIREFGPFGGMIRHMDYQPYLLGIGVCFFLFILSIVGVVSSKKQPAPAVHVYQHPAQPSQVYVQPVTPPAGDASYLINQAIHSYNARDYGNAIAILSRAASISPADHSIHFNLAMLYSLTQQKEPAFHALKNAISLGYSNFEKIRTLPDLSWLRSQPEYTDFMNSGYRNVPTIQKEAPVAHHHSNDDMITKLERLAKLKEQGVLTIEEYNMQKAKVLQG